ncbi:MAG: DUF6528 family protein [Bryobacterales bacterium]|nr:DUF6528 family protein [Bryobacterales bacterium]
MPAPKISRRQLIRGVTAAASVLPLRAATPEHLLVCGGNVVYDAALSGQDAEPRWESVREWRAAVSKGLPRDYVDKAFATTDECKSIDDGRNVLLTASSGGVAIYERESLATLFHAHVVNAHSACMLPGGYIVVASSVSREGNALVLFHRSKSEQVVFRTPLESAHGTVWDENRKVLYALGMDRLEEYSFESGVSGAALKLLRSSPLPSRGGHDLSASMRLTELLVTTQHGVYVFDKTERRFRNHPELGDLLDVKCVSTNLSTGRLAWVKADEGQGVWWSFRIRFLYPEGSIASPGERVYKIRWA